MLKKCGLSLCLVSSGIRREKKRNERFLFKNLTEIIKEELGYNFMVSLKEIQQ